MTLDRDLLDDFRQVPRLLAVQVAGLDRLMVLRPFAHRCQLVSVHCASLGRNAAPYRRAAKREAFHFLGGSYSARSMLSPVSMFPSVISRLRFKARPLVRGGRGHLLLNSGSRRSEVAMLFFTGLSDSLPDLSDALCCNCTE